MIEVRAQPDNSGSLVSYKAVAEQTNTGSEQSIQQEITDKIYSDPDYRKQLLLRVLPKFDKLDQFDQLHDDAIDKGAQ